jgi:hypothetical protein
MKQYLFLSFLLIGQLPVFAQQEIRLENTCNEGVDSVLFTDATNFFRIANWPGKAQMRLECDACIIEFKGSSGNFTLMPSENPADTLSVFQDEQLLKKFILAHRKAEDLSVHLKAGKNKTVSRQDLNPQTELVVKAGLPGCKTKWDIISFEIVMPAGVRIACKGNTLCTESIQKLQVMEAGTQFKIENTNAVSGDEKLVLPDATYFFRD